jgi:structure-specific recognition protein 1
MTSARTFDIRIVAKAGETTFTSINKEEYDPVEQFLTSKKIRIKNEMNEGDVIMAAPIDEDSDEEMGDGSDESDSGGKSKPVRINMDDEDSEEGQSRIL